MMKNTGEVKNLASGLQTLHNDGGKQRHAETKVVLDFLDFYKKKHSSIGILLRMMPSCGSNQINPFEEATSSNLLRLQFVLIASDKILACARIVVLRTGNIFTNKPGVEYPVPDDSYASIDDDPMTAPRAQLTAPPRQPAPPDGHIITTTS
ncbi:hypothetical protein GQ600_13200 [Phytophthora cactorum]|nr:hypothetical protein GQ600_13200 [Phytophthora cactorum]